MVDLNSLTPEQRARYDRNQVQGRAIADLILVHFGACDQVAVARACQLVISGITADIAENSEDLERGLQAFANDMTKDAVLMFGIKLRRQ